MININLNNFFNPKSVAIIGVSRNPKKIGQVLFRNLIDGGYKGHVYLVNPKAGEIMNHKVYSSILKIKEKIDLTIIAIPAKFVFNAVKECNKKGVKDVLIISSGFKEIGNVKEENKLEEYCLKNKIRIIGVNCLGIFDAYNNFDTVFLPRYRLKRPEKGGISFVCQSGAIGSAILDLSSDKGHKFSKFISYGNATIVDESDLLEYLEDDENTKVICLYVEGVKDGDKFFKIAKRVSKKKPIIALKGGITEEGSEATLSHTGALAGAVEVYKGIFKQTGIIEVSSLEEMFNVASLIEKVGRIDGNRIQVITNGGGYGILTTDAIVGSGNLELAKFSKKNKRYLRSKFSRLINIRNPLDLVGDADSEMYRTAIESCLNDRNIDLLFVICLYQTPLITTDIVDYISGFNDLCKKPIVVVSTGGEFTEVLSSRLEENGVVVYTYPEQGINSISKLFWWSNIRKKL